MQFCAQVAKRTRIFVAESDSYLDLIPARNHFKLKSDNKLYFTSLIYLV